MKIEFVQADYVDLPLDRSMTIEKGINLLNRANDQAKEEQVEANVEYQLMEGDNVLFSSSIDLPQEDFELLAEIKNDINDVEGDEEEKEALLEYIAQAFPTSKKNENKNAEKPTIKTKEKQEGFLVEFLGPKESELPLQEPMAVDSALVLLRSLNQLLEEKEDSIDIDYQLIHEEMIYFQSSLFLPISELNNQTWKKEIEQDLEQTEADSEDLLEIKRLLDATFTQKKEPGRKPKRKLSDPNNRKKKSTVSLPIKEKPKSKKLQLEKNKTDSTKEKSSFMAQPKMKQLSVTKILVAATFIFSCLSFSSTLYLSHELKSASGVSNEVSVNEQLVTKTSADTFATLFLKNYFTQEQEESTFKSNIAPYVSNDVLDHFSRQDKQIDSIYPWSTQKEGEHWRVSFIVTYKDQSSTNKVTVNLKEDNNTVFTVSEVPVVEKNSYTVPD
ncbi:hypothetical protein ACJQ40_002293 [Enterococcus faecium]